MIAFPTIEDLRAATLRVGHPLQAAILQGRYAGQIAHTNHQGSVSVFCKDHPKLTARVRYRQEQAIDDLISRDIPRPASIPRVPGLSDRALEFSMRATA